MKLPVLSGKELVKALSKAGYEVDHITGDHAILRKQIPPYNRVTVPLHRRNSKRDFTCYNAACWNNQRTACEIARITRGGRALAR